MAGFEPVRPCGRLLWCAGLAAVVVACGAPALVHAQQSVMPAFGEVEDVVNYVDDIYSYLKARGDGVIGRGRPERLPK